MFVLLTVEVLSRTVVYLFGVHRKLYVDLLMIETQLRIFLHEDVITEKNSVYRSHLYVRVLKLIFLYYSYRLTARWEF